MFLKLPVEIQSFVVVCFLLHRYRNIFSTSLPLKPMVIYSLEQEQCRMITIYQLCTKNRYFILSLSWLVLLPFHVLYTRNLRTLEKCWKGRKSLSMQIIIKACNLLPQDVKKAKSTYEFKKESSLCTENRSLVAAKHDPEDVTSGLEKSLNC